jgi:hypothetical protein
MASETSEKSSSTTVSLDYGPIDHSPYLHGLVWLVRSSSTSQPASRAAGGHTRSSVMGSKFLCTASLRRKKWENILQPGDT